LVVCSESLYTSFRRAQWASVSCANDGPSDPSVQEAGMESLPQNSKFSELKLESLEDPEKRIAALLKRADNAIRRSRKLVTFCQERKAAFDNRGPRSIET